MEKEDTHEYDEVNTSLITERNDDTVNTTLLQALPGEDVVTPTEDATNVPTTQSGDEPHDPENDIKQL
jgi:hypothetical protein